IFFIVDFIFGLLGWLSHAPAARPTMAREPIYARLCTLCGRWLREGNELGGPSQTATKNTALNEAGPCAPTRGRAAVLQTGCAARRETPAKPRCRCPCESFPGRGAGDGRACPACAPASETAVARRPGKHRPGCRRGGWPPAARSRSGVPPSCSAGPRRLRGRCS